MFKIGDFSKICQVTRQTLRHWDAIDLLKPAHIDPQNQYRYYTVDQITDVNRILALQLLGLTLNEIQDILSETAVKPSEADMREMYEEKIHILNQRIEEYTAQREMLEVRLRNISSDRPFTHDIVVKSAQAVMVYSYRKVFATIYDMSDAIREIYAYQETGRHLAISVSHVSAIEDRDLDVEIGLLKLKSDIPSTAIKRLSLQERIITDGEDLVTTISHGSWLQSVSVYNEIGRWIAANGYQMCGPWREIYHRIDKTGPAGHDSITEFQFPVVKI